ncbi:hypothetical protein DFH27DRAFT_599274, partial [Peziza echinospora]
MNAISARTTMGRSRGVRMQQVLSYDEDAFEPIDTPMRKGHETVRDGSVHRAIAGNNVHGGEEEPSMSCNVACNQRMQETQQILQEAHRRISMMRAEIARVLNKRPQRYYSPQIPERANQPDIEAHTVNSQRQYESTLSQSRRHEYQEKGPEQSHQTPKPSLVQRLPKMKSFMHEGVQLKEQLSKDRIPYKSLKEQRFSSDLAINPLPHGSIKGKAQHVGYGNASLEPHFASGSVGRSGVYNTTQVSRLTRQPQVQNLRSRASIATMPLSSQDQLLRKDEGSKRIGHRASQANIQQTGYSSRVMRKDTNKASND